MESRVDDPPAGWTNPITAPSGSWQRGVDPSQLLPSRGDLIKSRLEFQRSLILYGRDCFSPILATERGVIYDGHHSVRASAEAGRLVDVLVVAESIAATSDSILSLPVR